MIDANSEHLFQSVELLFGLKLHWIDNRLNANITGNQTYISLTGGIKGRLWFPDIYIINSRHVEIPTHTWEPSYARIHKDGNVIFSILTRAVVGCPMNFEYYPVSFSFPNMASKYF